MFGKKCSVALEFKLQDLWIGVFYKRSYCFVCHHPHWHIYVCLVPMFPLHIVID